MAADPHAALKIFRTQWLSLREPTDNIQRTRWLVSEAWRELISAPSFGGESTARREGRREVTLTGLLPAMVGYLGSFAASSGARSCDVALTMFGWYGRCHPREKVVPFEAPITQKGRAGRGPSESERQHEAALCGVVDGAS